MLVVITSEEELSEALNKIKPKAKEADVNVDDKAELKKFFFDAVASNIRVVLCFAPGEAFRLRARNVMNICVLL
jgi:hypothetical protein